MRCAAYTRATPWKDDIDLSNYTAEKQSAAVAAYITKRGWEKVKSYSDRKGNDGLFAMQEAGLAREFETVVFPSIYFVTDDFPLVTQRLQESLYASGVQFAVADENFYSGEKNADEVAGYFEEKRRERHCDITKNWKDSKGDGFVLTNSVPFGYFRRDGENQMMMDELLKDTVNAMFHMASEGIGFDAIADWLNSRHVDTPSIHRKKRYGRSTDGLPQEWKADMVKRTMRNPVYTGARVNKEKRVVKENCYESYLTREQFEAIFPGFYQAAGETSRQKKASAAKPKGKQDKKLSVYCAECGRKMYFVDGAYYCGCGQSPGRFEISSVEEQVMAALDEEQKEAVCVEKLVRDGYAEAARVKKEEQLSVQMKTILAETELEQIQRVPLYDSFKAGEITEEEYSQRLLEMRASYKALDDKLSACMKEKADAEKAYSLKNLWLVLYVTPFQGTKHEIMRKNTQRVEVDKNGIVSVTVKERYWKEMLLQAVGKERG